MLGEKTIKLNPHCLAATLKCLLFRVDIIKEGHSTSE